MTGTQWGPYVHRHLKHLRSLNLYGGDFTDDGLRMLTGLTVLRSLKLGYCDKITDKGFRALIVSLSQQCLARVDVDSRYNSKPLSSVSPRQAQIRPRAFQPPCAIGPADCSAINMFMDTCRLGEWAWYAAKYPAYTPTLTRRMSHSAV